MHRHLIVSILVSALILYGGLYPFHGWVSGNAIAFLGEKVAHRSNYEDVFVNILVFVPLGFSATLALNTRYRIGRSIAVAIAHGFFLSFAIEAFQAFLPMRYSSITDLLMNTLGTSLGSLVALGLRMRARQAQPGGRYWLERSPLTRLALTCTIVWVATQVIPFNPVIDAVQLRARVAMLLHWPSPLRPWSLGTVLILSLAISGLGMLLSALSQNGARVRGRVIVVLMLPVFARLVVGEHGLGSEHLFGALIGALAVWSFPSNNRKTYAIAAALAIVASFILSEVLPGMGGTYRVFNWIPFRMHLRSPMIGVDALLDGIWPAIGLVTCIGLLVRNPGWLCIGTTSIAVISCVLALELLQARLPGRIGDITLPLVMGAVCILSFLSTRVGQTVRAGTA